MENNLKQIQNDLVELGKYIISVENKVKTSEIDGLEIQKFEDCMEGNLNRKYIHQYEDIGSDGKSRSYSSWSKPQPPDKLAEILRKLNAEFLQSATEKHERNLPKIAINKKIVEGITKFMQALGIPSSYRVPKKSRSRYQQYENINAGYITDCSKIPQNDTFDSAKREHVEFEKKIVEYLQKKQQEIKAAEQVKVKEEASKKAIMDLARMQVKYGEHDWSELLEIILAKNKYLALAHALLQNRNDWNDGYSYAESGLHEFSIESPYDQTIHDSIYDAIENWDGDGRVFRDLAVGSYDELFSIVSQNYPDLYKDYQEISSHNEQF